MTTSFLRFAFGFLVIVAVALTLVLVLGVFGSRENSDAQAPAAMGSVAEE